MNKKNAGKIGPAFNTALLYTLLYYYPLSGTFLAVRYCFMQKAEELAVA